MSKNDEEVIARFATFLDALEQCDGHGGFAGKSLVEKIRDDLDDVFRESMEEVFSGSGRQYNEGLMDGIAHCLAVLRSSSRESELDEADTRYRTATRATP